mgnify:CR=1 FL=1
MIAFDTNLLVRALVADNPDQVAVVRQLITADTIFIPRTVLLETEWVLRSRYKKTRAELNEFFTALLETDDTLIEDAEAVSLALDWYARGADLADALHLAACGSTVYTHSIGASARPRGTQEWPRRCGFGRFETEDVALRADGHQRQCPHRQAVRLRHRALCRAGAPYPDSLRIRRWGSPDDVEATKLCFKKGDIIFARRRAYQRKLGVAEFDGICSAHAMVLRARPEVVLPEFLPFFMQSDLFMNRAVEISVGSLSPTINWKTMAVQEFALPPMEEQQKTLQLLSVLESQIETLVATRSAAVRLRKSAARDAFSRHYGATTPSA